MANEVLDRTDMILHLLGECEGTAHQARDPLAERIVESLDVISFAGQFGDRLVLRSRNYSQVGSLSTILKLNKETAT